MSHVFAIHAQTTVVSLTLNGVKRVLRMDSGSVEQKECLDNADAYLPADNVHTDLTAILQPKVCGLFLCRSGGIHLNEFKVRFTDEVILTGRKPKFLLEKRIHR
jgi:hypothetical protein